MAVTRRDFVRVTGALPILASSKVLGADHEDPSDPHYTQSGPRKIRVLENVWIPMPDGTRIAARIWIPVDAEQQPVPAILEYIPYRKRDSNRIGDERTHPFLATHGYACVRADIRGSGDSDGLPQDEYVQQEQDDGVEIIAWLAKQPWCSGKVGMFGISWGGASSLQVASRRPPALAAIIVHCSTDDRYSDDGHYLGGCINESIFHWGSTWMMLGLRPPDPVIVGNRWREEWIRRLNHLDFYLADWLSHQQYDSLWKHGSVCEDYRSIECPVYAVGGWVDPYRSAIVRLVSNLQCPRKGLIGPWGHQYPHQGNPGPAIDWLTESMRWWDHWLKGKDTGIMEEPMFRAWMQESAVLRGTHFVSGRWVAEEAWPSPRIRPQTYYLTGRGLEQQSGPESRHVLKPMQTVGMTAPRWYASDMDTELPTDQRLDDARSLCFDSAPLDDTLELLGAPSVRLDISVDRPVAFLMLRLNEVEPDGLSKRVSYGILNLTQRNSRETPEPLEPGKRYPVAIRFQDCAQALKAGSRVRLAMSTTYWPMIWPSQEPVTLRVYAGSAQLILPVRPPRPADADLAPFGSAPTFNDDTEPLPQVTKPNSHQIEWDLESQKLTHRNSGAAGYRIKATGTEVATAQSMAAEIQENDPTSASIEYKKMMSFRRRGWDVRSEAVIRMSVTAKELLVSVDLKAHEENTEVFARTWHRAIPRRYV